MNSGVESMAKPLRFHPLVADDLVSAGDWYDEISTELGNRFRDWVDASFDAVESRSEAYGMVDPPLRAARVNRFPYLILFEITITTIEVLGVFHTASDPDKWRKRKG